jgi:hypothetical protein
MAKHKGGCTGSASVSRLRMTYAVVSHTSKEKEVVVLMTGSSGSW